MDPLDRRIQPHLRASFLDDFSHARPHHARAQPWVLKLPDQCSDVSATSRKDCVDNYRAERQISYSLRRPICLYVATVDSPDLLCISLEENLKQPPSKSIRNPSLEVMLRYAWKQA